MLALVFARTPALHATHPNHPVKVSVPFPAGGVNDIAKRKERTRVIAVWDDTSHPAWAGG